MVNDSDYTVEVVQPTLSDRVSGSLTQWELRRHSKPSKPLITIITLEVLIYCREFTLPLLLFLVFVCICLVPLPFHASGGEKKLMHMCFCC